eukprot:3694932-Pyramimonas_sp.AAC.2
MDSEPECAMLSSVTMSYWQPFSLDSAKVVVVGRQYVNVSPYSGVLDHYARQNTSESARETAWSPLYAERDLSSEDAPSARPCSPPMSAQPEGSTWIDQFVKEEGQGDTSLPFALSLSEGVPA